MNIQEFEDILANTSNKITFLNNSEIMSKCSDFDEDLIIDILTKYLNEKELFYFTRSELFKNFSFSGKKELISSKILPKFVNTF